MERPNHRSGNRELVNFALSALITLTMIWSMFPAAGLAYAASADGSAAASAVDAAPDTAADSGPVTGIDTGTVTAAPEGDAAAAEGTPAPDVEATDIESAAGDVPAGDVPAEDNGISSPAPAMDAPEVGTEQAVTVISQIRLEANAAGATFSPAAAGADPMILIIDPATPVELSQPYECEGHVFTGWSTTPSGGDTQDMSAFFVQDKAVLINWTYLFDANGDGILDAAAETFDLADCVRSTQSADGSARSDELTLYAQWQPESLVQENPGSTDGSADAGADGIPAGFIGIEHNQNALADVRDIDGGAADELSLIVTGAAGTPQDQRQSQEQGKNQDQGQTPAPRRSARSVAAVADSATSVDTFTVKWITQGTDASTAQQLVLEPRGNSLFPVTAQIDLALSGTDEHPAGSVRIHIPAHIFQQRGTDAPAYGNLALPLAQSPSTRTVFNWSYVDGEYILVNTRALSAAAQVSLQLAYENMQPSELVSGSVSADLRARLEIDSQDGVLAADTSALNVQVNTQAYLDKPVKNDNSCQRMGRQALLDAGYTIPDAYADETTFVVVEWLTYVRCGGNTYFRLSWEDSPEEGSSLKWFNVTPLSWENSTDGWTPGLTGWHYISIAYPASQFEQGQSYHLANTITWKLTETDTGITRQQSATAQVSYRYQTSTHKEPPGHFHHEKNGLTTDPSALNSLMDDQDRSFSWTTYVSCYTLPWTWRGTSTDPSTATTTDYGGSSVTVQMTDGELSLINPSGDNTHILVPGTDFDFTSLKVEAPTIYKAVYTGVPAGSAGGYWTDSPGAHGGTYGVGYKRSYDSGDIPPVTVEALVNDSWTAVVTLDFTDGSPSKTVDFSRIEGTVQSYRISMELGADPDGDGDFVAGVGSLTADPTITLHPSEAVQEMAARALSKSGTPRLYLENADHAEAIHNGEIIFSEEDQATNVLRGFNGSITVFPSKEAYASVDNATQTATVHYNARVRQISNFTSLSTWKKAVHTGALPVDRSATWYDLLPQGAVPVMDSIRLRQGDSIQNAYAITNYKGSGRTLLVVKARLTPQSKMGFDVNSKGSVEDSPYISFDATYSFDSMRFYGNSLHNVIAYASDNGSLGTVPGYMAEPDTPFSSNNAVTSDANTFADDTEKTLMVDLDPADDNPRFVYAGVWIRVSGLAFSAAELDKQVMVNNDGIWGTGATGDAPMDVYAGGVYRYRLSVASAQSTNTSGIIFYDNLEAFTPGPGTDDAGDSTWRGTFAGVDTSALEAAGADPVLYYATREVDIADSSDPSQRSADALLDSGVWSTTPPDDLGQVRAIAIDVSHAADGSEFILGPGELLAAYVLMKAPGGAQAESYMPGGADADGAHAYNNAYLWASTSDANNSDRTSLQSVLVHRDYTKVGIKALELTVTKVFDDNDNADNNRPASVVLHLLRNGQRLDPDVSVTLDGAADTASTAAAGEDPSAYESEPWVATFTGLDPAAADGSGYAYSIEEEVPAGYAASVIQTGEDTYLLTNTYESITIYVTKTWSDPEEAPSSLTLELLRDGQVFKTFQIRPDHGDNWSSTFTGLPRYHDGGVEYVYTVRELNGSDWLSATSTATDSQGNMMVDLINTYHPYGDLLISKTVTGTADSSQDFVFTVHLENRAGHGLSEPVLLRIEDAEGTTVSEGTFATGDTLVLRAGWKAYLTEIPGRTIYRVSEESVAGYTAKTPLQTGTITSNTQAEAPFVNVYGATGAVTLHASKTMEGAQLSGRQFKFVLRDAQGQTVASAHNDSQGNVVFSSLNFTQDGAGRIHSYTMSEVNTGFGGISYSADIYQVQVSVADNGDGTLSLDVVYLDPEGTPLEAGAYPVFSNSYHAEGRLSLVAYKTMETGTVSDYAGKFSFSLYNQDGQRLYLDSKGHQTTDVTETPLTARNTDMGTVVFPAITYTRDELRQEDGSYTPHTFIYQVKEDIPEDAEQLEDGRFTKDGIIYSSQVRYWQIDVQDPGNGILSITEQRVNPGGDGTYEVTDDLPVFTNAIAPGTFSIEKHVVYPEGTAVDPDAEFAFQVNVTYPEGASAAGTLHYVTQDIDQDRGAGQSGGAGGTAADGQSGQGGSPGTDSQAGNSSADTAVSTGATGTAATRDSSAASAVSSSAITGASAEPATGVLSWIAGMIMPIHTAMAADATDDGRFSGTAYAVYTGSDKTLTFIRSHETHQDGEESTIHDRGGNAYTGTIYAGIEDERESFRNWLGANNSSSPERVVVKDPVRPRTLAHLFDDCYKLRSIEHADNIDTSQATSAASMFSGCGSLQQLDLSSWDTGNVTDMSGMFMDCPRLQQLDVSGWDTGNVTIMDGMFAYCYSLEQLDLNSWDTRNLTSIMQMFYQCASLQQVELGDWNTARLSNMDSAFDECSSLQQLDVGRWDTSNASDMGALFRGCSSLRQLDVSNWNMGNVTYLSSMFKGCSSLEQLDVSRWDMGNIEAIDSLFSGCSNLQELDVSNWNTGAVTSMSEVFADCDSLQRLDLNNWDTSQVIGIQLMFIRCSNLQELGISSWNTSSLTDLIAAFKDCSSLQRLDLSGWDVRNVRYVSQAFAGCTSLQELDLSGWNTAYLRNADDVFKDAGVTRLDLSGWDLSSGGRTVPHNMLAAPALYELKLGPAVRMTSTVGLRDLEETATATGFWINRATGQRVTTQELVADFATDSPTLTGTWVVEEPSRNITFDANGGAGSMAVITYTGDAVTLPASSFHRPGYRFTGWNTAADGAGQAYAPGDILQTESGHLTADVVLYAQWEYAGTDAELPPAEAGFTVTLKAGQRAVFDGLPAGSQVEVRELPVSGWTLSASDNTVFTVEPGSTNTASFTNTRTTAAYTAEGTARIGVSKMLHGRPWEDGEKFVFTLTPQDGAPLRTADGVVDSLSVEASAEGAPSSFAGLIFTEADLTETDGSLVQEKTFTYLVQEQHPDSAVFDENLQGWVADGLLYASSVQVQVAVSDNGDGTLAVSIQGADVLTPAELVLDFVNTYQPPAEPPAEPPSAPALPPSVPAEKPPAPVTPVTPETPETPVPPVQPDVPANEPPAPVPDPGIPKTGDSTPAALALTMAALGLGMGIAGLLAARRPRKKDAG